ncbi:unnamed protein product [Acanthoscelides obtectus]|uniref:Structure-specific endonuclease subunit SLX4 n=1 Tax=Acanthoscelides obtectus TaxID=200917 RepID=A0A9P0JM00_ACAOB|nr:unnamed protein product [Acanthoscelides obtectus]CAK1634623.1 Structure-specific endonuclease subunit SLX4 [Acanthoscelides obtectus]
MNKFKKENDSFDSPYRHCLSEIKCVETNNEDDSFATPTITRSKVQKQPAKRQIKKNTKCKSQRIDAIFKKAKDKLSHLDVNPDHLQMAIALSKSTFNQENPVKSKRLNVEERTFDPKLGSILERYGFRSSRSVPSRTTFNQEEAFQQRKRSRFLYALFSTAQEDKNALIDEKISTVISQPIINFENGVAEKNIFSNILKNCHVIHSKLLKIHSYNSNEDASNYYTRSLNLERTLSSCGSLLKNWESIPGRESPNPEEQPQEDYLHQSCRESEFELKDTKSDEFSSCSINIINHLEQTPSTDSLKEIEKWLDIDSVQVDTSHGDSCSSNGTNSSDTLAKRIKLGCIKPDKVNIHDAKSGQSEKTSQYFNTTSKLSETEIGEGSAPSRSYCVSPDLFSSEDEESVKITEKCMKLQGNAQASSNQKGIECYESFSADSSALSQEMYTSVNSKACDNPNNRTRYGKVKDDQDKVILILDSDDDSNVIAENKTDKKAEEKASMHTTDLLSCLTESFEQKVPQLYGPQYEIEDKSITEQILSFDKKSFCINGNEKCGEHKLFVSMDSHLNEQTENPAISTENLEREDQILEGKNQGSMSPLNCLSTNLTVNMDFDEPRCSSASKLYSPSFNSNSKLNVTEYIENMLGEDYVTDDVNEEQHNNEISLSQSSSGSIVISDEELNCTKLQQKTNSHSDDELEDEKASYDENIEEKDAMGVNEKKRMSEHQKKSGNFSDSFDELLQNSEVLTDIDNLVCEPELSKPCHRKSKSVENKDMTNLDIVPITPKNKNKLIIKTRNVTPMPDYEKMSSAEIVDELKKFRVKPLKRQRGITMLKYIYECTHPLVPTTERYRDEVEENRVFKKRRKDDNVEEVSIEDSETRLMSKDIVCKNDIIESENPEDLIFERKIPAKLAYCRIPLQIVWYNFVQSNSELKKNILLYEPIHLNSVYAMLKEQSGCKFHMEDFITFLDKKSITFRTS